MSSIPTQKLYVIGNGFDLHHGLATSFSNFKNFIVKNKPSLKSKIEDYLCDLSGDWANLEEAFAYFDVDQLMDHASDFLVSYADEDWSDSYHHDYQYEINEVVRAISTELKHEFYVWLNGLDVTQAANHPCRLSINTEAFFLNFNYTPVIQQIYSINESQVLHIHGAIVDGEEGIFLGHGWVSQDRPRFGEDQAPEDMDTRVMEGNNLINRYFESTFKPTDALIKKNQKFFNALVNISDIYIWGHSLSDVDLPYFSEIEKSTRDSNPKWHVSHYNSSGYENNVIAMEKIGVKSTCVQHHKLSEFVL